MSGMFGEGTARLGHKSVEWYTPKWVFDELGIEFDLDPASPHDHETFVPAKIKLTIFDDGLSKPWHGRVWLNPPYGKNTPFWMQRMTAHNNGIALVFSRTDADWCQKAMEHSSAMLFLAGRVAFEPGHENKHKASRSGAGTLMLAYGSECAEALKKMGHRGVLVT